MSRQSIIAANRWACTYKYTMRASIKRRCAPLLTWNMLLMKDGKELGKQAENWQGMSDAGQRLTLARLIDSQRLAPGDYELTIRIRDRVSGQALTALRQVLDRSVVEH